MGSPPTACSDKPFSSGIITGWNNLTQTPYGHAIACGWGDGAANVDLTGTPFVLNETFCVGAGWGTIVPSPDGKSVNITSVNGWCPIPLSIWSVLKQAQQSRCTTTRFNSKPARVAE